MGEQRRLGRRGFLGGIPGRVRGGCRGIGYYLLCAFGGSGELLVEHLRSQFGKWRLSLRGLRLRCRHYGPLLIVWITAGEGHRGGGEKSIMYRDAYDR